MDDTPRDPSNGAWADDATANRVKKLAEQVRDELRGMNSDFRRGHVREMAERIMREADRPAHVR